MVIKFLKMDTIRPKLILLILSSIVPCIAILLYSGIEQRQHLIGMAKSDVLLIARAMADSQKRVAQFTEDILSVLSKIPAIQKMDIDKTTVILQSILNKNPNYNNFALVDLDGDVLTSGKNFTKTNLSDRLHFKECIIKKAFSPGEYIVTRVGTSNPSFPFAFPVMDEQGRLKAVLTAAIKLNIFPRFFDTSTLPEKSFVSITDHQGIRLFYYPAQNKTNPIGAPIAAGPFKSAYEGGDDGLFFSKGSDGLRRLFAYEKVYNKNQDVPYMYVWAGIPENYILAPANMALIRNLIISFMTAIISIVMAWLIGKKTLISPIKNLVTLTEKISKGNFENSSNVPVLSGEIGILTTSFYDMASALKMSMTSLKEYEHIVSSSKDMMAMLDRQFKYLVANNAYLGAFNLSSDQLIGKTPSDVFGEEFFNTVIRDRGNRCLNGEEIRYGEWFDFKHTGKRYMDITYSPYISKNNIVIGFVVNARDITDRKQAEEALFTEKEKLEAALLEINTLKGILPICSHCKKIRDDKGYWNQIEGYIQKHSDAKFSHGMCPECSDKLYGKEDWYIEMKNEEKQKE